MIQLHQAFMVYGHDESAMSATTLFAERLEPVVFDKPSSQYLTAIEKYASVGCAINFG